MKQFNNIFFSVFPFFCSTAKSTCKCKATKLLYFFTAICFAQFDSEIFCFTSVHTHSRYDVNSIICLAELSSLAGILNSNVEDIFETGMKE